MSEQLNKALAQPFMTGFDTAFDVVFFAERKNLSVQDTRYRLGIRNCFRDPGEEIADGSLPPSHPYCSNPYWDIAEREFGGDTTLVTSFMDGVEALVRALDLRDEAQELSHV